MARATRQPYEIVAPSLMPGDRAIGDVVPLLPPTGPAPIRAGPCRRP